MSRIAEMFRGMDRAESFGQGQYFEEGSFILRAKTVKTQESRKTQGIDFFIAEFEVLESSNPDVLKGSTRSYVTKIQGNQYAFGEIKNLLFALVFGIDPKNAPPVGDRVHALAQKLTMAACDTQWRNEFAASNDPDAPEVLALLGELIGAAVKLETFKKATRPKPGQTQGGTFTVHTWAPVEEAA